MGSTPRLISNATARPSLPQFALPLPRTVGTVVLRQLTKTRTIRRGSRSHACPAWFEGPEGPARAVRGRLAAASWLSGLWRVRDGLRACARHPAGARRAHGSRIPRPAESAARWLHGGFPLEYASPGAQRQGSLHFLTEPSALSSRKRGKVEIQ